jgi:hypothetical protein
MVRSPTGGQLPQKLQLYGINDKMGNQSESEEVRRRLESYTKGRSVKCFTRSEANQQRHECWLGNNDIALWAIERELVKPSSDAPGEYRKNLR